MEKFVKLIQAVFQKVHLVEDCTWQTVFPIPNGDKEFCGIGMVEVLWKTVTGILNRRLTVEIQFQDTLHGFHTGRGKGTASLEPKLLQYLTDIMEEVLYTT